MEKINTEYGTFTNNETTGQTAQEVYDEWLANKDKPPEPTEIELLQQEIAGTNAMLLEFMESMLM